MVERKRQRTARWFPHNAGWFPSNYVAAIGSPAVDVGVTRETLLAVAGHNSHTENAAELELLQEASKTEHLETDCQKEHLKLDCQTEHLKTDCHTEHLETNSQTEHIKTNSQTEHLKTVVKPATMQRMRSWIPGPQTLIELQSEVSWELLINNVLKCISDLNYSARVEAKDHYLLEGNQIVRSIKDMMAYSDTASVSSAIVKSNQQLLDQHAAVMTSLSRLVLSARVSAGIWPPEDAVHKMRYQAGQVLLAVRKFVGIAQDYNIPLNDIISLDADDFDLRGAELSNFELINQITNTYEVIVDYIASLIGQITSNKSLSISTIEKSKAAVIDIGQFLSVVEDAWFENASENDPLVSEFISQKEMVYVACNDLISTCATGADPALVPADSWEMMLEATTTILESLEEVMTSTKELLNKKEILAVYPPDYSKLQKRESDLDQLHQRTQSISVRSYIETHIGGDDIRMEAQSIENITASSDKLQSSTPREHRKVVPRPPDMDASVSAKKISKFFGDVSIKDRSKTEVYQR